MKTAAAMKKQGFKYFSALTPRQKDETCNFLLKYSLGVSNLEKGLSDLIIKQMDFDEILKHKTEIDRQLKSAKMFKHEGKYYPLNIKEILKQ